MCADARRQVAGDQIAERPREDGDEHGHRHGEREKGDRVRTALAAEPALGRRAREIRDDDHPEGLRGEDEHEVDAVRPKEAVGLGGAAELVGEQRAGARRRERDHDLREPGERAAAQRARCSENVSVRESHRCPTLL